MSEIEEVEKLVMNSGNSFHCKVLNYLKAKGWTVLISPYYHDNVSDKPREIDLIAEKAFPISKPLARHPQGTINIKLFIECKYVPQKIVFWFHDKDKDLAEELVIRSTRLSKGNSYTKQHHYLNGNDRVAKLFASESKKSEENEIIYKALNQSLNAMVYFSRVGSILPTTTVKTLNSINYPVIVCNSFSTFYKVDVDSETKPSSINDHFQLEVLYAYTDTNEKQRTDYFLIDVLDFQKMDGFLDSLQSDVKAISEVLLYSQR
ncbi:MAG: hypothetical protein MPW15_07585 [Candidatus Manganitrophus sp.]|nr:hypothetical protein [Candidatus Manganitrophus sp.]